LGLRGAFHPERILAHDVVDAAAPARQGHLVAEGCAARQESLLGKAERQAVSEARGIPAIRRAGMCRARPEHDDLTDVELQLPGVLRRGARQVLELFVPL